MKWGNWIFIIYPLIESSLLGISIVRIVLFGSVLMPHFVYVRETSLKEIITGRLVYIQQYFWQTPSTVSFYILHPPGLYKDQWGKEEQERHLSCSYNHTEDLPYTFHQTLVNILKDQPLSLVYNCHNERLYQWEPHWKASRSGGDPPRWRLIEVGFGARQIPSSGGHRL